MSSEIPTDDQAASGPRSLSQFVMDFVRMTPRERSCSYDTGYKCLYMTANEYFAANQQHVNEYQYFDWHLDNMDAGAVTDKQLEAYEDRLIYEHIMVDFTRLTADGRISREYADGVLRTVAEAIKVNDPLRGDEDFTGAIYNFGYVFVLPPQENNAQTSPREGNAQWCDAQQDNVRQGSNTQQ